MQRCLTDVAVGGGEVGDSVSDTPFRRSMDERGIKLARGGVIDFSTDEADMALAKKRMAAHRSSASKPHTKNFNHQAVIKLSIRL